jgi:hypothetical protein
VSIAVIVVGLVEKRWERLIGITLEMNVKIIIEEAVQLSTDCGQVGIHIHILMPNNLLHSGAQRFRHPCDSSSSYTSAEPIISSRQSTVEGCYSLWVRGKKSSNKERRS